MLRPNTTFVSRASTDRYPGPEPPVELGRPSSPLLREIVVLEARGRSKSPSFAIETDPIPSATRRDARLTKSSELFPSTTKFRAWVWVFRA